MEAKNTLELNAPKINESTIIQRILGGEKELFEILVRRNNQKLYRVIRSYLMDAVEIEDVMQNSYINAYTKLYQFKLESSFSTWLIRIGINETLKRLKEKGKVLPINEQADNIKKNMLLTMTEDHRHDPDSEMIRKEVQRVVENAIDQLPEKYRAVFVMKEVEDMSINEIAFALDLTPANVKVRQHRAKEMLKEKLAELSNEKNLFQFGFSRCDRITRNVMDSI